MNSLSLHASASLHTTLSPRLQRAVRLLQMSSQDFAQVVRDALDSNPFLEQEELPATADSAPMDENRHAHPLPRRDLGHGWCEPAASGRCRRGRVRYARGPRLAGGPSAGATQCAGACRNATWRWRRPWSNRSTTMATCACPLEEVAESLPMLPAPEPQELLIALRRVQALDPTGVGARSVCECLQLQLQAIPAGSARDLAAGSLRSTWTHWQRATSGGWPSVLAKATRRWKRPALPSAGWTRIRAGAIASRRFSI